MGLHLRVEILACEEGPSHTSQHIQVLAVQSTAKCRMQKVVELGNVAKAANWFMEPGAVLQLLFPQLVLPIAVVLQIPDGWTLE